MHISQAKEIPLSIVVEHLGGRYSHTNRQEDLWYFSPFRPEERTASFKINQKTNKWYDFGLATSAKNKRTQIQDNGGDIIDLWCDFHLLDRRDGIKQTLDALAQFTNAPFQKRIDTSHNLKTFRDEAKYQSEPKPPRYKIIRVNSRILNPGLRDELDRRRISTKLANYYLKQGFILDTETGRTYTAFLFQNDKQGYEISIPNPARGRCFKTSVIAKACTTIDGTDQTKVDIFEGFWDFLSWLQMNKITTPKHLTFVLNSLSFCGEAVENIIAMNYIIKSVFLFMDNDKAGFQATHAFAKELEPYGFEIGSRDKLYEGYKDLSECWKVSKIKNIFN